MDMSPLLSFIVPLPVFATPDCRSEAVGITVGRINTRWTVARSDATSCNRRRDGTALRHGGNHAELLLNLRSIAMRAPALSPPPWNLLTYLPLDVVYISDRKL